MSILPGLPALPPGVDILANVIFLTSDLVSLAFGDASQQWGIFLDGVSVVLADNVVEVDYNQNSRVANYPVEQGSFSSYNKVNTPFDVTVVFSTGGSLADRQDFLDSIDAISGDLNLYDVVTPEKVYSNCNVTRQSYRRSHDRGAGLIEVEVRLVEIRQTDAAQFSNTANPTAQSPKDGGLQQGQQRIDVYRGKGPIE